MTYGTIADWRAYALERGNSKPTEASDEDAQAALTRATDYIQFKYVSCFFPSYDEENEKVRNLVERAAYVAASIELDNPNFFTKVFTPSEQKVLVGVDTIRWQVTGDASNPDNSVPVSTLIEAMLGCFRGHAVTGLFV